MKTCACGRTIRAKTRKQCYVCRKQVSKNTEADILELEAGIENLGVSDNGRLSFTHIFS